MIVKLKNKSTKPYIKLNPDSPHEGQELTVIGFGDTDKGSGSVVIPTVLNQVDVTYITNEQCQSMHLDRYEISDDMICAMGDNKDTWYVHRYTCLFELYWMPVQTVKAHRQYSFLILCSNGDSGGPLILKGESSEEDELVGAVTW